MANARRDTYATYIRVQKHMYVLLRHSEYGSMVLVIIEAPTVDERIESSSQREAQGRL